MMWGLVLEPGKRYSTVVEKSFHVSMAALDCTTVKKDKEILRVILEVDEQENLLCNLSKDLGLLQQKLDLNFMSGDNITFEVKGTGVVHLTGYMVDDVDLDEEGEEEEDDESDVSEADGVNHGAPSKGSSKWTKQAEKRKGDLLEIASKKKKTKQEVEDSEDESDDDIDGDEVGSEEEGSDDEEDDDAMESEDEESDDDDADTKPQVKKKQNLINTQTKQQTPGKPNKSNLVNGATPNQQQQSGKKDKKNAQTPNSGKKPNTPGQPQGGSPKKKVIEQGVVIKDIKEGTGQAVKNGKMVQVYYTGRLKSNNKVFDSHNKGEGFQFRLGKGEVIKGWDIGLNGMKVGGKRTITCPPNVAYGSKGSLPAIPPNSTLIFEVEVKAVN
uniref:FK506-binding protein n=1 Tax=Clastoptera arizonana TaxID=38151 RepID=A0A1B6CVU2_9HEMI